MKRGIQRIKVLSLIKRRYKIYHNLSDGNDSISMTMSLAVSCHVSQIIMNEIMLCFCNILYFNDLYVTEKTS